MAQLEQLLEEPLVAQQVAALAARVDDSHAGVSKEEPNARQKMYGSVFIRASHSQSQRHSQASQRRVTGQL
eukprot:361455-Chlamydomonas_euryale.AAC.7